MEKFWKIAYYGFLVMLGVIALLVIFSAFPILGNYEILVVRSGSMEPTISMGSVVVVSPSESYKIGDIITFTGGFRDSEGNSVPVTHRVVEMRVESGAALYTTKGDANEDADGREKRESQIAGKVLFDIPYVGYAVETARTPYGFLALIIIPAAIIIFDQARNIRRELARKKTGAREN